MVNKHVDWPWLLRFYHLMMIRISKKSRERCIQNDWINKLINMGGWQSLQHFPRVILWRINTTTLYQAMLNNCCNCWKLFTAALLNNKQQLSCISKSTLCSTLFCRQLDSVEEQLRQSEGEVSHIYDVVANKYIMVKCQSFNLPDTLTLLLW